MFTKSHLWFRKASAKLTSNFIFLQAINYMIVAFCAYSGEISFLGILGDYTKYALHFSGEVYTTGLFSSNCKTLRINFAAQFDYAEINFKRHSPPLFGRKTWLFSKLLLTILDCKKWKQSYKSTWIYVSYANTPNTFHKNAISKTAKWQVKSQLNLMCRWQANKYKSKGYSTQISNTRMCDRPILRFK